MEVSVDANGAKEESKNRKRPREYYERVYFDFLRVAYPTVEQFADKVEGEFQAANYAPRDYLSNLSRDVLCCIANHLDIISITHLSSCCVALRAIVSLRFNDYWKQRAMAFRPCMLENEGVIKLKKQKLEKRVTWFDAFHWLVADSSASRWASNTTEAAKYSRLLMGRQTFHTWLRDRRPGLLPPSRNGPRLFVGERDISDHLKGVFAFSIPFHVANYLCTLAIDDTTEQVGQAGQVGQAESSDAKQPQAIEMVTVETRKTYDEWVDYISAILVRAKKVFIDSDYQIISKSEHKCRVAVSNEELAQMGLIRYYQDDRDYKTGEKVRRHYCYCRYRDCLKYMMSEKGSVFGDALHSEVKKYVK